MSEATHIRETIAPLFADLVLMHARFLRNVEHAKGEEPDADEGEYIRWALCEVHMDTPDMVNSVLKYADAKRRHLRAPVNCPTNGGLQERVTLFPMWRV